MTTTGEDVMPSKSDLDAVLRALSFAAEHHVEKGAIQVRKGTSTPYVSHLMIVAGLVWESGGDTEQVVAAVLHDVLEDTDVTEHDLAERFGDDVTALVKACSDGLDGAPRNETSWKNRKQNYLNTLATKPGRAKLITAADKAHNGSAIVADVQAHGTDVWRRFNASPAEILWYYEGVLNGVIENLESTPVLARLQGTVAELRRLPGMEASR